MTASILIAAGIFAFPPLFTLTLSLSMRLPVRGRWFLLQWAAGGTGGMLASLGQGDWRDAAAFGSSGLLALILWWRSRRKRRKRSLKALGHKARARLAAMARNMPRPAPVLRPVPQGA